MREAERRREIRERDAQVAREAILHAARDIFAARGFSGARVDDIAEAAGYNKALIFHYFSDKLGLYQTLVARMKSDMIGRFSTYLSQFEDGSDGTSEVVRCATLFTSCLRWIFDYYASHPEIHKMMLWEAAEGWHTFSGCAAQVADPRWPLRISRVVRQAQADGIIRPDLSAELPLMMCMTLPLTYLGSIHRFEAIFGEQDYATPEALIQAREQMASVLVRGILTPEAASAYAAISRGEGERDHATGV